MSITFLILSTPFIQLGFSYYASVASISVLISIVALSRTLMRAFISSMPIFVIIALMFLSVFSVDSEDAIRASARILRECVVLFVFVSIARNVQLVHPINFKLVQKPALLVCVGLFCLALIQSFYLSRGAYFGFPESMFALESKTIADDLALTWGTLNQGAMRPNGTFNEPSYLGFVLLSFLVMFAPAFQSSRISRLIVAVTVATGFMSRSLSFLLAAFLIEALPLWYRLRLKAKLLSLVAILLGGVAMLNIEYGASVFERIGNLTSPTEGYSAFVRVYAPLTILPKFLIDFPLGVPYYDLPNILAEYDVGDSSIDPSEFLQNAIFNLFFQYGFVGGAVFAALVGCSRDPTIRLYTVMCGMFNGALLSLDKLAVMLLAILIFNASKQWANSQRGRLGERINLHGLAR